MPEITESAVANAVTEPLPAAVPEATTAQVEHSTSEIPKSEPPASLESGKGELPASTQAVAAESQAVIPEGITTLPGSLLRLPVELARLAEKLDPSVLTLWVTARDFAAELRSLIENGESVTIEDLRPLIFTLSKVLSDAAPFLSEHQKTVASLTPTDAASLERLCRDIQLSIHQA